MPDQIDWSRLKVDLAVEYGFSEKGAGRAIQKLKDLTPTLFEALTVWLSTGVLASPTLGGYTVERLVNEKGMSPPAAFLAMDWIARDPETAVETLNRGRYDTIRP